MVFSDFMGSVAKPLCDYTQAKYGQIMCNLYIAYDIIIAKFRILNQMFIFQ